MHPDIKPRLENFIKVSPVIQALPDKALNMSTVRSVCGSQGCVIGWCAASPLFADLMISGDFRCGRTLEVELVTPVGLEVVDFEDAAAEVFFGAYLEDVRKQVGDLFGFFGDGFRYDRGFAEHLRLPYEVSEGGPLSFRPEGFRHYNSLNGAETRRLIFWRLGSFLVEHCNLTPDEVYADGYVPEGFKFMHTFDHIA